MARYQETRELELWAGAMLFRYDVANHFELGQETELHVADRLAGAIAALREAEEAND